ncbi:MAG: Stk1 family PASTA domain-containing Ser/Thr kinase [Actinomycetes bacterium]
MANVDSLTVETSAGPRITDPLVGRLIDGRYRVEQRLARGGMATVYEATDLRLDRVVALKIMHPTLAEDSDFVSRFIREAKSAARLTDPHVVAVYDQGTDSGLIYLVMEYVPGRTVRDVLREHGRLAPEQALTILDPVLQALEAAHTAGFVHRDVKPENVLLTDDGRVKVADFGLARAISTGNSTQATQGLLIGTVAYLSPEQVQRGIADARSDVYGAGILLYEMLTGAVPFAGETPLAVAYQHVNANVPAPSSVRTGIPSSIDALVIRATQRDPDSRFASAASFLAELRTVRAALPAPRPFGVTEDQSATLVVPIGAMATIAPNQSRGSKTEKSSSARGKTPKEPKPPKDRTRRRRRRGPIALLALLLIGAIVGGAAWFLGVAKTVTIPALANHTIADAQDALTPLELTLAATTQSFSETVEAGRIISTTPRPGAEVRQGTTVEAVVSKGPERFLVPALAGMTVDEATTTLLENSLTVGTTNSAYSAKVPKGAVISTKPAAGVELKRDQSVALVVSKGLAPIPLPDYSGVAQSDATAALDKLGLKHTITTEFSKTIADGIVISSTPKAGASVAKGSSVALVVSKGPAPVIVPDLYRVPEADARKTLTRLGFQVAVSYPIGFTPFGRVVKQSAKAGSSQPFGSTISLDVV